MTRYVIEDFNYILIRQDMPRNTKEYNGVFASSYRGSGVPSRTPSYVSSMCVWQLANSAAHGLRTVRLSGVTLLGVRAGVVAGAPA